MAELFSYQTGQKVVTVGRIFGTPLGLQGLSWLPINQLLVWILFTWHAIKTHPFWPVRQHLVLGGLRMVVVLGSEWCHNIAHAAAARAVGQPVDAMRIIVGMPVLLYTDPEHLSVTSRQHIIRSAAGPVCSFVLLGLSKILQRTTQPGSAAREVADAAAAMNTFISCSSLVPVPEFDGGPILKWSLISSGVSRSRTDQVITSVNRLLGVGLAGASVVVAAGKRRWLVAAVVAFLGFLCLRNGFGEKR